MRNRGVISYLGLWKSIYNDIAKKQMELLRKNKSLKNLEYIDNKVNDNLLIDTK